MTGRGFQFPFVSQDCQILQQIQNSSLALAVKIPSLEGLVSSGEGGGVAGYLTNYVETNHDLGIRSERGPA